MASEYEAWLGLAEEVRQHREPVKQRELPGGYDSETGCSVEEMEASPAAKANRKEAA